MGERCVLTFDVWWRNWWNFSWASSYKWPQALIYAMSQGMTEQNTPHTRFGHTAAKWMWMNDFITSMIWVDTMISSTNFLKNKRCSAPKIGQHFCMISVHIFAMQTSFFNILWPKMHEMCWIHVKICCMIKTLDRVYVHLIRTKIHMWLWRSDGWVVVWNDEIYFSEAWIVSTNHLLGARKLVVTYMGSRGFEYAN